MDTLVRVLVVDGRKWRAVGNIHVPSNNLKKKTLQVLVLIWTLLKQGPEGRPVAKKVVVVAPSTLVGNWANETKKWLGDARLRALPLQPCPEAAEKIRDFRFGVVHHVLVVSYELIRKFTKELAGCCDVLICDEGHRLKSAQGNKTINALLELQCSRRILLTGTPIQNKLDEFYAMMSFVNPDLLGSLTTFKRLFADPISKSRDRNASQEEKELGEERSRALNDRIARFVLRRTSELNTKHLPPLSVFIAFCKPSDLQVDLYNAILRSGSITSLLSGTSCFGDRALSAIMLLRKLCNHPELLRRPDLKNAESRTSECGDITADLQLLFPKEYTTADPVQSGKLRCLSIILNEMVASSDDRIVVVSNSTANLDVIQALCEQNSFPTVRIDGSTAVASRQDIVDNFNSVPASKVFLLSTRAGGAGLNLIGANRLVLFDSDWNPAVDQQAMARIWRDGQRRPCVVYRLLTTGTIDEKMYQRQLMKTEIADMVADRKEAARGFTKDELKELFTLNLDTDCNTRDILKKEGSDDWQNCGVDCSDEALRKAFACEVVSFVQEQRRLEKENSKLPDMNTTQPQQEPAKATKHTKGEEVSKKPGYCSDDVDILMIDD
ncbi:hypothetical protein BSKO_03995 [Bryopsis sp. KO-2023]|nr:hypothetical protein BSKO_03995 [Bryopsis sp. KO-2023]